ncbi:hypothetical protein K1719_043452 [Acacia pycnantha]|nr:hypothetical protein K1719_043452 [Acacia pycnantha]
MDFLTHLILNHLIHNEVQNQLGKTIKALRSDRGGEYLSQEFIDHLRSCGIISQLTPPGTPQWNDVSERRNRTLLDMVRSMMSQTDLPPSFWGYALETAAFTLNRVPSKAVEKTPYEIWTGENLETKGYYVYIPTDNKVFIIRNGIFLEKEFISKRTSESKVYLEEVREPQDNVEPQMETGEDSQQDVEPAQVTQGPRRSDGTRLQPQRYGFLITGSRDVFLIKQNEPTTHREAVVGPNSER